MKQITVTLNVSEEDVLRESEQETLEAAIDRELGWLHDSGMSVEKWEFADKPKEVSVLCEEYEDKDGIRSFQVLGVSEDKEFLQEKMKQLIDADEYGYIAGKGIDADSDNHFSTNFDNGFVEYYIFDEPVLSREMDMASNLSQDRSIRLNPFALDEFIAQEVPFRMKEILGLEAPPDVLDVLVERLKDNNDVMFDYDQLDGWLMDQYENVMPKPSLADVIADAAGKVGGSMDKGMGVEGPER